MNLQEINELPSAIIESYDGELGNIKVYLVQDFNHKLLRNMVDFGLNIFGELGMDEWGLVPQIRHGNVFVLREEEKKKIVGLAILMRDWEDTDKCYLFDFAIDEDLQGIGFGTHFLISICDNLKEQGFKKMSLTVDVENKPAIRLYKDKIGFEIDHFSKDEYGKGHDRYIMELDFENISDKLLEFTQDNDSGKVSKESSPLSKVS